MTHDHSDDHTEPPADIELRVKALETLLVEKRTGRPGGSRCAHRYL